MLLVHQGANAFLIRQAMGHKSFDSTLAYVNSSDADASAALLKAFNPLIRQQSAVLLHDDRISLLFLATRLRCSASPRKVMLHFGRILEAARESRVFFNPKIS
jgi:hypothetical protein